MFTMNYFIDDERFYYRDTAARFLEQLSGLNDLEVAEFLNDLETHALDNGKGSYRDELENVEVEIEVRIAQRFPA